MKIKKERNISILILILATVFWGSTFAFTKDLTNYLHPFTLVAIRFGITTVLMFVLFFKSIIQTIKTIIKKDLSLIAVLGLVNLLAISLQTFSLKEIEASNNGFITSFALLIVPFIEYFFRKKKVRRNIKIAVVISMIGIYIMSYGIRLPNVLVIGDLLALLSAFVYAVYIILVDILSKRIKAGSLMFFAFLTTTIVAVPLALIFEGNLNFELFSKTVFTKASFNMLFLAVLGTIVPYVLMGLGQRKTDAQTASLIYILEPVFAVGIAVIFFSEPIGSVYKFIGAGLILTAQYIGIRKQKQQVEKEDLAYQQ